MTSSGAGVKSGDGDRNAAPSGIKLAIVGPTFFSYTEAIVAEFERRGIRTATFDEKHSNHVLAKILYRLGLGHNSLSPLPRYLRMVADEICRLECTDVLLSGVEVIDRPFVERVSAQGIRVHLYMWDGHANKGRFRSYLDLLASRATFDPQDSRSLGMTYIPLFAEETFDEERLRPEGEYAFDIGFCGTVHSSRSKILAQMLTSPWARNRSFALMLYYHSRALFLIKGLVAWSALRLFGRISSRPFSKAEIARMFARTRYILDIPHPGQTGMTARTFEVLLAGSRLLTFNRAAAELLPRSLQERVQIIDRISDAGAIDFDSCQRMTKLNEEERYFLSLQRFVDQLLETMKMTAPIEEQGVQDHCEAAH